MALDKLCFHSIGIHGIYSFPSSLRLPTFFLAVDLVVSSVNIHPHSCYTLQETSIPHARVGLPRVVNVIRSFRKPLLGRVLNDLLFHDSRSHYNLGNLHFNHFFFLLRSESS